MFRVTIRGLLLLTLLAAVALSWLANRSLGPPDGEIVWTNPRAGTVWINRGSADSLGKQATFSVYSTDANKVATGWAKARVKVTRILGEHMAEAKIVGGGQSNPITPGDMIFK